ncbi:MULTISPECIES: iron uptake porin [Prochlorococcus]|uniref:iron uptake porin n=1 Tax=Prochlorococcus TaxID=1218 RepID=UPI000533895F|nr:MULTISPECIES: iron uptake porin [Prochlorococcus]KGG12142.1 Porin [Prochlorococcus sp. MIT 0601]
MNLFRKLFLAPAALGLVAPLAAHTTEVNITDIANYGEHQQETKTQAQFSDVAPGDWSYEALASLTNRFNCQDNEHVRHLRNGSALTRYEAASLVNNCLESNLIAEGEELDSDTSQLVEEFRSEMAILKGRIDGLEYKLKELSAGQFSSTTKLSGGATYTIGAASWENGATDSEALHSIYSYEVLLKTSFTGKDILHAGFEAGNYSTSSPLLLETSSNTSDELRIDSLYYSFPMKNFTLAIGPKYDLDELSPSTMSTYSNSFFFKGYYIGPNAFSKPSGVNGAGAGFSYFASNGFNFGASFAAVNSSDATLGIGTDEGIDGLSITAGYDARNFNFGGGVAYTKLDSPSGAVSELVFSLAGLSFDEDPQALGLGMYWSPTENFDVSFGLDFIDVGISNYENGTTFSVGVDLGIGPGVLSAGMARVPDWDSNNNYDPAGSAYELYYQFKVSEAVSVKPGLMVTAFDRNNGFDSTRYAVETTFKF